MTRKSYIETFDSGPGGWIGWTSNAEGAKTIEIQNGVAISRSPWWIDYNHAPPGGGYLHILFGLQTKNERYSELAGPNRFIRGGFPTDFTRAKITVRLRGEIELRGAELVLLAQSKVDTHYVNCVLTGQPLEVTSEWSEQTITLVPDVDQWQCIGSRHDRTDFYGWGQPADVLGDLNGNIIFVLFPLGVVPAEPLAGDPHHLRAGEDYATDPAHLPEGVVMLDEVRIEFLG